MPPATRHEVTGREKAAMLLVALGAELASRVMKHLSEEEIEVLTYEIANLPKVEGEHRDQILRECLEFTQAQAFVATGGVPYARQILEKSLGSQRAEEVLERLGTSLVVTPFDAFRRMDPMQLASLLQQEHPQTIALVMSYLKPRQAASLLSSLPVTMQADVAARVALMDRTSPETIREVENALEAKFTAVPTQEFTTVGGVQALVTIINESDRATEKAILEAIEERDPELATEVKKLMFVFEDLLQLDDRAIQLILRSVDGKDLPLAMKGASEDLKEKILRNMSQRAAETLREDLTLMGAVRVRDVEEAQTRIVASVRLLEEQGQIMIVRGNQEGFIA